MTKERLQKILSKAGIASRRKAEELIAQGKVRVNDRVVQDLGSKADPRTDKIAVDGKVIRLQKRHQYFAYHKPRGVLVTKRDELGRKGIFDKLQLPPQVNAVGRLDKDSEGLLLLSDDGAFIQAYTHPSYQVPKVYRVEISRPLKVSEKERLLKGVKLGEKEVRAHRIRKITRENGEWLEIELREGIKREIRRMMELFEIKVRRLIRVRHGKVSLGDLKAGRIRKISKPLLPQEPKG